MSAPKRSVLMLSLLAGIALIAVQSLHPGVAHGQSAPPPSPTNVQATAIDANDIQVTWRSGSSASTCSVENAYDITIDQHSPPGHTVTCGATSYTWSGLAPGSYRCFSIRASNSAGNSAYSPWSCTTTPGSSSNSASSSCTLGTLGTVCGFTPPASQISTSSANFTSASIDQQVQLFENKMQSCVSQAIDSATDDSTGLITGFYNALNDIHAGRTNAAANDMISTLNPYQGIADCATVICYLAGNLNCPSLGN